MKILVLHLSLLFLSFSINAKQVFLGPSNNSQEEIQEALIDLEPGDILTLKPGEYFLKMAFLLTLMMLSLKAQE